MLSLLGLIKKKYMNIFRYTALILAIMLPATSVFSQERISENLEVDKTVHNFGDILLGSGPVGCTFTIKNIGDKPAVIYNVVTTCGCTDVQWTVEPIRPGGQGKISATYSNDEGPYPFDKNLTVYVSDTKKPVILKLRGISTAEKKPLSELYPVHYGPLAFRESKTKCCNIEQGKEKSETLIAANISDRPISVGFRNVSDNMSVNVSPNPIPAQSTAEVTFRIKADRNLWGNNTYIAIPVIDGKSYSNNEGNEELCITAFTKENFDNLSQKEKDNGPKPLFKESTYSFGKVKKGQTIHAEFRFRNDGKESFRVYKADANACCWSHSDIPVTAPGEEGILRVHLETDNFSAGEHLTIVTLTTNSPLRPIINLFIAGFIE